jgi:hypothetical protein
MSSRFLEKKKRCGLTLLRFENQKTEKGTDYYRAKAEYTPGNGDSESGDVEATALPFRHGHLGVPSYYPAHEISTITSI